jgi:hypothetical protein
LNDQAAACSNLKVLLPQGSAKGITSKFYPLRIDLDKTGSTENTNGSESKQVDSLNLILSLEKSKLESRFAEQYVLSSFHVLSSVAIKCLFKHYFEIV